MSLSDESLEFALYKFANMITKLDLPLVTPLVDRQKLVEGNNLMSGGYL